MGATFHPLMLSFLIRVLANLNFCHYRHLYFFSSMTVSRELFFTLMIAGMIERRLGFDVDIRLKLNCLNLLDI